MYNICIELLLVPAIIGFIRKLKDRKNE